MSEQEIKDKTRELIAEMVETRNIGLLEDIRELDNMLLAIILGE